MKSIRLGTVLAGLSAVMTALGVGCVAGGSVGVDADYYGPGYGGPVIYGHPYYGGDARIASPPSQNWRGGAKPSAPARESHSAPVRGDRPAR